jgi:hypothetical protein
MKFLRLILSVGVVYCLWVGFTHSWTLAFLSFLAVGVCVWVGTVTLDAWNGLRRLLTRPNVNVYMEERHDDPTRPDEHPLIVLNETQWRRRK